MAFAGWMDHDKNSCSIGNLMTTTPALFPRFIRMSDAPRYLGMCRTVFNQSVRPHVREFPIGRQGIAFDRTELDRWADSYVSGQAIDKKDILADYSKRSERRHGDFGGTKLWHVNQSADSRCEVVSGTSTRSSKANEFTKALDLARGKRQNASSSTV